MATWKRMSIGPLSRPWTTLYLAASLAILPLALLACGRKTPTPAPTDAAISPVGGDAERLPDLPSALPSGRLAITVGEHRVQGLAWPEADLPAAVELRDGEGRPRGRGDAEAAGEGGWIARLDRPDGEPAELREGDRLIIEGAEGAREVLRVPGMRLRFDRENDRVEAFVSNGLPPTRAPLTLTVRYSATAEARIDTFLETDSLVRFQSGGLQGASPLTFTLGSDSGRWQATWLRTVPYLRVSLHPGDVIGNLRPGAALALRLLDGQGVERGRGLGRAARDGSFTVWALDSAGRRQRARPGDHVVVDDGETSLALTIPEFSARWDLGRGLIEGHGPPGAGLEFTLWNPWRPGETETPRGAVGADGAWSLRPAKGLHPASHYYITTVLPRGDKIYHCEQAPMLYVSPAAGEDGPSEDAGTDPWAGYVEVQTLWETRARLELLRGGRVVAGAEGGGPWSGNVWLRLRDDQGRPFAPRAGDRLRAAFPDGAGGEQVLETDVSSLRVTFDALRGRFVGRSGQGAAPGLAEPERPIPEVVAEPDDAGGWTLAPGPYLALAEPGWGGALGLPPLAPGGRAEVFATMPGGHNLRRRFLAPFVEARLGAAAVTGRLPAPEGFSVRLLRPGGEETDLTPAVDGRGQFTATLPAGAPTLAAADRLQVFETGQPAPILDVEISALSIEGLDGGRLTGRGPVDSTLDLEMVTAEGEPPFRIAVSPDGTGAWSLDLLAEDRGLAIPDPALVRRYELVHHGEGYDEVFTLPGPAGGGD